MGAPALTVTPDPDHAGEGGQDGVRPTHRWLSSAAVSSTSGGRRAASRLAGAGAPAASGGVWVPAACWPHTVTGPARSLRLGLQSCGFGVRGSFLDGLGPQLVTAHESLVVAVDGPTSPTCALSPGLVVRTGPPVIWESAAHDVELRRRASGFWVSDPPNWPSTAAPARRAVRDRLRATRSSLELTGEQPVRRRCARW